MFLKQGKSLKKGLVFSLISGLIFSSMYFNLSLKAEDYSDEGYWLAKCTKVQTTQEGVTACEGFQEYRKQQREELSKQITAFNSSIDSVKDDAAKIEALALEQKQLSENLQKQISEVNDAIADLNSSIDQTNSQIEGLEGEIDEKEIQIEKKQEDIEMWDNQIKERMKSEQVLSGTNTYIDLVMGSDSLADMFRRISGLERITQSDQDQINDLNILKESLQEDIKNLQAQIDELEFMKADLERLKADQEDQKELLEQQEAEAKALEESYEALVTEYQKKLSELEAQLRSAQQDMDKLKDFVISTGLTDSMNYDLVPKAAGWMAPVDGYRRSAGTWAYNGGGIHLGLDMAASIGNNLRAPISGLVIYTSNTQPTNSGYLGNWSGAPYGSGNCIEMVGQVNGTTYAIAFFHLSNEFYVSPGSLVNQGDIMALTGNSGNSTGAHTHVEIYNLGSMSVQEAVSYFQRTGDWAFQTSWGTTSTACEYKGSTPCRERPEQFF